MKKSILLLLLLLLISVSITSSVLEENYIPGILVICLSKQTVGNTQGDFLIEHDSEGIVVTPFKWFNSLAEE